MGEYKDQLQEGTILNNKYKVISCLSRSEKKFYYLANDLEQGKTVTVAELFLTMLFKRVLGSNMIYVTNNDIYKKELECFVEKAQIVKKYGLETVQVYSWYSIDYFYENGTAYRVMEDIRDNVPLDSFCKNTPKVNVITALNYISAISDGLRVIHNKGLVHGDLDPWRVYIREDGIRIIPKTICPINDLESGIIPAYIRPGYCSVERYGRKNMGPWTDIYSMAAILYKMITGKTLRDPMTRLLENYEERMLIEQRGIVLELPEQTINAIMKALSVDWEKRYKTVDDFLNDLV